MEVKFSSDLEKYIYEYQYGLITTHEFIEYLTELGYTQEYETPDVGMYCSDILESFGLDPNFDTTYANRMLMKG